MRVVIMQPAYLPWLGYFERIFMSDVFIALDTVAMDRSSKTRFLNRNRVRTKEGAVWLTVPLKKTHRDDLVPIRSLFIDNERDWAKGHLATLRNSYGKAAYFEEYYPAIDAILSKKWETITGLNAALTEQMGEWLGVAVKPLLSSTLDVDGTKSDLILNLCKAVGATEYVSGPFGRDYLEQNTFAKSGIKIIFHDYAHPTYLQRYGEFVPYLSAIDLLLNCGPGSKDILLSYPSLKVKT